MGIDESLKQQPHMLRDLVRTKVQQDAVPAKIKLGIEKANRMLGTFLKVNQNTIAYDYGQGYYVSEPKDLRPEGKVSSVEIMKQMQTKMMKKK